MGVSGSILVSVVTTLITFCVLEFIAKPVRRFFDLRREVSRQLALFANVGARWKRGVSSTAHIVPNALGEKEERRLDDAERVFRDLASQMRSFAQTDRLASSLVGAFGFNPFRASSGLFGLSNNIAEHGEARASSKKTIEESLRLLEPN